MRNLAHYSQHGTQLVLVLVSGQLALQESLIDAAPGGRTTLGGQSSCQALHGQLQCPLAVVQLMEPTEQL